METNAVKTQWPPALCWWIDAVGGFLTFLKPEIRIGQAGSRDNDVAIMADISSHHLDIRRGTTNLHAIAHAATTVNGKAGESFLLNNGDKIQMRSVEMTCHQPIPWSPTARLQITSRHRLPQAMDAIVLLGETCVIGPKRDAHIQAEWDCPVYITWHRDSYWIRCAEGVKVDGKQTETFAPLTPTSEVSGPWGDFRWEPVT